MVTSSTKIFLFLLGVFIIAGLFFLTNEPKGTLVIFLDHHHSPILDFLFRVFTFLGDGTWFGILFILFLFLRYSWALAISLLGIIQLLLVQGLKRGVFGRMPRPAEYFKDSYQFQPVEGIDIHHFNSFPSGHTATAFGIAAIFIFLFKPGKTAGILLFLLAMMVGISRMYLAQHFLEDIIAGAIVGVFSSFLVWRIYRNIEKKHPGAGVFNTSLRDKF